MNIQCSLRLEIYVVIIYMVSKPVCPSVKSTYFPFCIDILVVYTLNEMKWDLLEMKVGTIEFVCASLHMQLFINHLQNPQALLAYCL